MSIIQQESLIPVSFDSSNICLNSPNEFITEEKSTTYLCQPQSWNHPGCNKTCTLPEHVQFKKQTCTDPNVQELSQASLSHPPQHIEGEISSESDGNWNSSRDQSCSGLRQKFPKRHGRIRNQRDPYKTKILRKNYKKGRNDSLKRLLKPKNAMSILRELYPNLKITLSEQRIGDRLQYDTTIEIDGRTYNGTGYSKESSHETGSENALKCILLEKLEQIDKNSNAAEASKKEPIVDEQVSTSVSTEDIDLIKTLEGEENVNETQDDIDHEIENDNASWGFLASYAIHKLFLEWQSQGLHHPARTDFQFRTKSSNKTKTAPDEVPKKHPVQLLNEIKPNCHFVEAREGTHPNLLFFYSVTVDGQLFSGSGRSKKLAKKDCAKNALAALGVKYICL